MRCRPVIILTRIPIIRAANGLCQPRLHAAIVARDRSLACAGVPVWIDRDVRIANAKAMVIDDAVPLTGSQ